MTRHSPKIPILNISDDPYRHQPSASTSSATRAPSSPPRIRQSASTSSTSPSSIFFPPSHDHHKSKHMTGLSTSLLPLNGTNGVGTNKGRTWLIARFRGTRLKWIILLGGVLVLFVWSRRGNEVDSMAGGIDLSKVQEKVESLAADKVSDARVPVPAQPFKPGSLRDNEDESERPIPKPAPARPPLPPKNQPIESDESSNRLDSSSPIDVPVRPQSSLSRTASRHDPSERFLAYSPHSGYHNQRISVENALTLAYLLDRTLLIPPIWLGHAIPYISFDKLQRRLEMASKTGLEKRCVPFGDGSLDGDELIPRECLGFWDWTTVDWNFLVDLEEAEKMVKVERRDNLSMEWIGDEFGISEPDRRGKGGDIYSLKDDTMYQYRFYDSKEDREPLDKWTTRIDVEDFKAKTDSYRLVHVGSMFGTSRLRTTTERAFDARSTFRRAMMFRNEEVDEVTEDVKNLLGGEGKYYGLHLRVGDGIFQKNAKSNMKGVWDKLCREKMKLGEDVCDEMRRKSELEKRVRRDTLIDDSSNPTTTMLSKRANSRPQREGAFHHAPLPPLPKIRTLSDSPLSSTLTCRRPLHTEAHLLAFNAPLYIATDSKLPLQDPNLSLFFSSFPCSFTLSDFSQLPSLNRMNRLRNEEDKTPLAQFLYPQLDAQIAAWGRGLVGTPQSTYSRFAIDVLHQMYHGWDIVERG